MARFSFSERRSDRAGQSCHDANDCSTILGIKIPFQPLKHVASFPEGLDEGQSGLASGCFSCGQRDVPFQL
jgi:hypothetical protein